jgi:hypothetical protein
VGDYGQIEHCGILEQSQHCATVGNPLASGGHPPCASFAHKGNFGNFAARKPACCRGQGVNPEIYCFIFYSKKATS